jgi:hypothetical protein
MTPTHPALDILQTDPVWHGAIMYADDLALIAHTPGTLQLLLDETQKWAEEHFAQINYSKTHIMAFMETEAQTNDRMTWRPHLTVYDETLVKPAFHQLKEVTQFKYLGFTLDQTLSGRSATSSMIQAFWFAHHKAHKSGIMRREHHPLFLLTLWNQLILSAIDTHITFIHNAAHLKKLDSAINTSLATTFAPHSCKKNTLLTALKAELGIPSAKTMSDMAILRLHARLAQAQTIPPSAALYRIYVQNPVAFQNTDTWIPSRTQKLCADLLVGTAWNKLSLDIPQNAHIKKPLLPHTIRKRWLCYQAQKLYLREQQNLMKWCNTPGVGGRQAAYLQITKPDHGYMTKHLCVTKNPFQPLPYIKNIPSPTTVRKLMLIRAQSSQLPIHVAVHRVRPPAGGKAKTFSRTPYQKRLCPFCLPPPHTWGLLSPGADSPLGTEAHTFLTCTAFKNTRLYAIPELNNALRRANIPTLNPEHPWTNLTPELQLQTLLASTWPQQWKYKKRTLQNWYIELDTILEKYFLDILPRCTEWIHQTQGPK